MEFCQFMHTGTNAEVPVCVPTATVFVAASALKPGAAKGQAARPRPPSTGGEAAVRFLWFAFQS